MKKILIGLVGSVSILMSSLLYADVLGGGDDKYIGLQMRIPFEANGKNLFSARVEYSALLITQQDGYKEGITFTQDIYGNQSMGYLRPSNTFHIGRSNISDYSMPLLIRNQDGASQYGLVQFVVVGAVVVVAFGKLITKAADHLVCAIDDSDPECPQDE